MPCNRIRENSAPGRVVSHRSRREGRPGKIRTWGDPRHWRCLVTNVLRQLLRIVCRVEVDIPYSPPIIPVYIGPFLSGTVDAKTIIAPLEIPAHPRPAMARPTMRAFELGAVPQMGPGESTSKIANALTLYPLEREEGVQLEHIQLLRGQIS